MILGMPTRALGSVIEVDDPALIERLARRDAALHRRLGFVEIGEHDEHMLEPR